MNDSDVLAERFEAHRARLRTIAYHALGSASEVDDAVQEAWLRLSRSDPGRIENLGGWLTTVVARVCLDMLRSRREEPVGMNLPEPAANDSGGIDPEQEALLADSIGPALLVVLHTLAPAERLAFVLHDVFDVPFERIAPIVDRSEPATRQLASRARRRLRSTDAPETDLAEQWELVDAFLAAARDGDFDALLKVLDPDVVLRADGGTAGFGESRIERGARAVASGAVRFRTLGYVSRRALVNGAPGVVTFDGEAPIAVAGFTVARGKIVEMNILSDGERLRRLDLSGVAG
jgi:RNA polymerase sigma factor (sigma-70 family)